jgi:hypothetical protein
LRTPYQLAGSPLTPQNKLRELAASEDFRTRRALAKNRATPPDVLILLVNDPKPRLGYLVCSRAFLDEDVAMALTSHPDLETRCKLASRRDSSEEVQLRLAQDESFHVHLALSGRPELSHHLTETLAASTEPLVRTKIAKRPDCSFDALRRLANDPEPDVCDEVARSPRTPPDILSMLARHSDPAIRVSVARRLDTPAYVRSRLLEDVDEQTRIYVAQAAYSSKDAATLSRLAAHPDETVRHMVACEGGNEAVEQLSRDENPRIRWTAFSRGVATDYDLLMGVRDPDPSVREVIVALSSPLPESVAAELVLDADHHVRMALAARPDLAPSLREVLAADADGAVRRTAARNVTAIVPPRRPTMYSRSRSRSRWIDESEMLLIARGGDSTSMQNLARNRTCTAVVRKALADSGDVEVRRILASVRSEPAVLARLLKDRDHSIELAIARNSAIALPENPRSWLSCASPVRQALAGRSDLSTDLLVGLVSDPSSLVRYAIATNVRTDEASLSALASDCDHLVRVAVAGNPNTSPATMREMLNDPASAVRETLLTRRLSQLDASSFDRLATNQYHRFLLARSSRAPRQLLNRLVSDESFLVVRRAARNRHTRPSELVPLLTHPDAVCRAIAAERVAVLSEQQAVKLAGDPSWSVREALARNPATPDVALQLLVQELTHGTKVALANHPNASAEVLDVLAQAWSHEIHGPVAYHPRASTAALDHLARDGNNATRVAVARNLNTSAKTLTKLSRDKVAWVRRAVADNLRTHPSVLQRLASDESELVREAVARGPQTKPATLEQLSSDPIARVRAAVAVNPRTLPPTLARLVADTDSLVHRGLAKNPNLSPEERVLSALY